MSEAKDRAEIGKYAAENGNAAAVHKYGIGESTTRLFKTKYLAALSTQMKNGDSEPVTAIAPGRRGRPLLLGELDKKVQLSSVMSSYYPLSSCNDDTEAYTTSSVS